MQPTVAASLRDDGCDACHGVPSLQGRVVAASLRDDGCDACHGVRLRRFLGHLANDDLACNQSNHLDLLSAFDKPAFSDYVNELLTETDLTGGS